MLDEDKIFSIIDKYKTLKDFRDSHTNLYTKIIRLKQKDKYLAKLKEKSTKRNNSIYTFIHKTHDCMVCNKFELATKYDLNLSCILKLIKGERKSHKGWSLKK